MAKRKFIRAGRGYVPPEPGKTHRGGSGSRPETAERIMKAPVADVPYGSQKYPVGSTPTDIKKIEAGTLAPSVVRTGKHTGYYAVRPADRARAVEAERAVRVARERIVPTPTPTVTRARRPEEVGMITLPEEKTRLQRIKEFAQVYKGLGGPMITTQLLLPTREAKGRFVTELGMFGLTYPAFKGAEFAVSPEVARLREKEAVAELTKAERAKLIALEVAPFGVGLGLGKGIIKRVAARVTPITTKAKALAVVKPTIRITKPPKKIKIEVKEPKISEMTPAERLRFLKERPPPVREIEVTPGIDVTKALLAAEVRVKAPLRLRKPEKFLVKGVAEVVKIKKKPPLPTLFKAEIVTKGAERIRKAKIRGVVEEYKIKPPKRLPPKEVFRTYFEEEAKRPRFKGIEFGERLRMPKERPERLYKTFGVAFEARKPIPFKRLGKLIGRPKRFKYKEIRMKGLQLVLPLVRRKPVKPFKVGIERPGIKRPRPRVTKFEQELIQVKKRLPTKVKVAKVTPGIPIEAIGKLYAKKMYRATLIEEAAAEPLAMRPFMPTRPGITIAPREVSVLAPKPITKIAPAIVAKEKLKVAPLAKLKTRLRFREKQKEALVSKQVEKFVQREKQRVRYMQLQKIAPKQVERLRFKVPYMPVTPVPTRIGFPGWLPPPVIPIPTGLAFPKVKRIYKIKPRRKLKYTPTIIGLERGVFIRRPPKKAIGLGYEALGVRYPVKPPRAKGILGKKRRRGIRGHAVPKWL